MRKVPKISAHWEKSKSNFPVLFSGLLHGYRGMTVASGIDDAPPRTHARVTGRDQWDVVPAEKHSAHNDVNTTPKLSDAAGQQQPRHSTSDGGALSSCVCRRRLVIVWAEFWPVR